MKRSGGIRRLQLERLWQRAGDGILALGLFAAALAVYVRTLAPSVVALFDDSLEFPLVVHRLAIAHPTGYPLYTLLARAFTLPYSTNVAWAVNLFSAVAAALAVALVYLAGRGLTRTRLPALLGAVALACAPVFWAQAVVAEVYALNSAFVAALLWLALRWARRPLLPPAPGPDPAGSGAMPSSNARQAARAASPMSRGTRAEPLDAGRLFLAADPNRLGELRRHLAVARRRIGEVAASIGRILAALRRRVGHAWGSATRRVVATYRRAYPPVPPQCRLRIAPITFALAAVYGLALAHHRTVLLLALPLLVFMLLVERRTLSRAALLGPEHPGQSRWRRLISRPGVLLVGCLLAPLLLYLYLPMRGDVGSLDGTYSNTFVGFLRWVTGGSYRVFLGENPLAREMNLTFYAGFFWQQFGPLGVALALAGVVVLVRPALPARRDWVEGSNAPLLLSLNWTRPRALALTGLAFCAYTAFAALYRVPDVEVFLIPALVIVAVWIAVGLDGMLDLLRPRGRHPRMRWLMATARTLLILAAAVQPLAIAARHLPDLDLSQRWAVYDFGRQVLGQPLPADSTVVGLGGEMTLLRTLQETEGLRPDVQTIVADDETARLQAVRSALAAGRTVYVTRPLPGLAGDQSLGAVVGTTDVGDQFPALIRVAPPYYEPPLPAHPFDSRLAQGMRLAGYDVQEHAAHWQAWARLRLWWRTPNGVRDRLKVSARLLNADGQLVAAVDAEPVANAYPTTSWLPGEVIADAYEIPLPIGLPPGDYVPLVVVYDPETGAEQGRVTLPAVRLAANLERAPRQALEATLARLIPTLFGDVELLGWTPPDPAVAYRPGDHLPLTLLWQARRQPAGAWQVEFALEGDDHRVPLGSAPLGGGFEAGQWTAGQAVRQWPGLVVPDDVPPGAYHLSLRILHDGRPVPWGRWLLPLGSDFDLGRVQVTD